MNCSSSDHRNCSDCKRKLDSKSCVAFCHSLKILKTNILHKYLNLNQSDIDYKKFIKFSKLQCKRLGNNTMRGIPGMCKQHALALNLTQYWDAIGTDNMESVFGISNDYKSLGTDMKNIFRFLTVLPDSKFQDILLIMKQQQIPITCLLKLVFSPLGFWILKYHVFLNFIIIVVISKIFKSNIYEQTPVPTSFTYAMVANLILRWIPWFENGFENLDLLNFSQHELSIVKWNKLNQVLVSAFVTSSSKIYRNILPTFRIEWKNLWITKFKDKYPNKNNSSSSFIHWTQFIQQLENANLLMTKNALLSTNKVPNIQLSSKQNELFITGTTDVTDSFNSLQI